MFQILWSYKFYAIMCLVFVILDFHFFIPNSLMILLILLSQFGGFLLQQIFEVISEGSFIWARLQQSLKNSTPFFRFMGVLFMFNQIGLMVLHESYTVERATYDVYANDFGVVEMKTFKAERWNCLFPTREVQGILPKGLEFDQYTNSIRGQYAENTNDTTFVVFEKCFYGPTATFLVTIHTEAFRNRISCMESILKRDEELRVKDEELRAKDEELRAKDEDIRAKDEDIRSFAEDLRRKDSLISQILTVKSDDTDSEQSTGRKLLDTAMYRSTYSDLNLASSKCRAYRTPHTSPDHSLLIVVGTILINVAYGLYMVMTKEKKLD